jgi:flagellar hook assembly protein FlgD
VGELPRSEALFLAQPYPNPFNPTSTVSLYVPAATAPEARVQVAIYDLRGRRVQNIFSGSLPVGWHNFLWDGRDEAGRSQASGIYFLQARQGDQTVTRKLSLVK